MEKFFNTHHKHAETHTITTSYIVDAKTNIFIDNDKLLFKNRHIKINKKTSILLLGFTG